mgnify:CR=1 FL=1
MNVDDARWSNIGRLRHVGRPDRGRGDHAAAQAKGGSQRRELFSLDWLHARLAAHPGLAAADVQRTLLQLTVSSAAQAIAQHAPATRALYVCGGGALNPLLMAELAAALEYGELQDILAHGLQNYLGEFLDQLTQLNDELHAAYMEAA